MLFIGCHDKASAETFGFFACGGSDVVMSLGAPLCHVQKLQVSFALIQSTLSLRHLFQV